MATAPDPDAPVIDVRTRDGVLLQVWADGRIAWSGDTIRPGQNVRTAQLDPAAVAAAIRAIENKLGGSWVAVHTGPDADVTTVRVRDGDRLLVDVGSWHEHFETDPRLVVTASGVEPLAGRNRADVLAQQPPEYRSFRERWDEVLGRLRALVPGSPGSTRGESGGS